ncbi:SDR family NAD(P)-dependent oxidoreductase [Nocardioides dilutus]
MTGASRGLGAAIATTLVSRGYRVALGGRDRAALFEVAARLGKGSTSVHPGDVTVAADRGRLVDDALDRWGKIDVLVNNAAVATVGSVAESSPDELESVIATNLTAPLLLTRTVLPEMVARGFGGIVNISSTFGLAGSPYLAGYGATKAALRSVGWSLSLELRGSGVHVTTAIPGPLRGDTMLDRLDASMVGELPWMPSVTATRAARRIVRAMERRRSEVVIAPGGRAGTASRRLSETAVRLLGVTRSLKAHAHARPHVLTAPPRGDHQ